MRAGPWAPSAASTGCRRYGAIPCRCLPRRSATGAAVAGHRQAGAAAPALQGSSCCLLDATRDAQDTPGAFCDRVGLPMLLLPGDLVRATGGRWMACELFDDLGIDHGDTRLE